MRMLFLNCAKAVYGLTTLLCLAGLMVIERTPIVAGAVTVRTNEEGACINCHKEEVNGFTRSKMAQSMRLPMHEPEAIVRTPQATFRMYSNPDGTWQKVESHGHTE